MKRKTDPLDSVAGQILENAKKSGLEINTAEDAENLMAHMLGRLLTQMLDGEMTNHLGYERGGKRVTENERNGHSSKTLKSSSLGNIRIDVPRDRKGEFEPRVVPKHKRQLAGFEDKVLALYARGLSTREIQGFLYDEYGMETSAEFISDVTDAILPEVEKWQNRPLDPFYTTVFFDAIRAQKFCNRATKAFVALAHQMPSSFRNSWSRFTDSVLQRLIPRGVITEVVFTQSNHSRT